MKISIGFTGTRWGMTPQQSDAVWSLIAECHRGEKFNAHHGDCVGSDEQFHELCRRAGRLGYVIVHPGPHPEYASQAGCLGDERHDPLPHMLRNLRIVAASTVMIATPAEMSKQPRGGTWATIRMARKAGKPLAIAWPDGSVTKERWT